MTKNNQLTSEEYSKELCRKIVLLKEEYELKIRGLKEKSNFIARRQRIREAMNRDSDIERRLDFLNHGCFSLVYVDFDKTGEIDCTIESDLQRGIEFEKPEWMWAGNKEALKDPVVRRLRQYERATREYERRALEEYATKFGDEYNRRSGDEDVRRTKNEFLAPSTFEAALADRAMPLIGKIAARRMSEQEYTFLLNCTSDELRDYMLMLSKNLMKRVPGAYIWFDDNTGDRIICAEYTVGEPNLSKYTDGRQCRERVTCAKLGEIDKK